MSKTRFLECGCCGCYHREDFEGDCRNNDERYSLEDLDFFFNLDDIEVIPLEEQDDISCGG